MEDHLFILETNLKCHIIAMYLDCLLLCVKFCHDLNVGRIEGKPCEFIGELVHQVLYNFIILRHIRIIPLFVAGCQFFLKLPEPFNSSVGGNSDSRHILVGANFQPDIDLHRVRRAPTFAIRKHNTIMNKFIFLRTTGTKSIWGYKIVCDTFRHILIRIFFRSIIRYKF